MLTAARGGQNSADFALAQLFSQGKGTKPDPVNAWVFAQLALASQTPQATELAEALNTQLPPEKLATAKDLLAASKKSGALPHSEHDGDAGPARRKRR